MGLGPITKENAGPVGEAYIDANDAYVAPYSSYIADAWEVWEKFPSVEKRVECVLIWRDDARQKGWYARCGEAMSLPGYHESAPLAICLAALKAKGVDTQEFET